MAVDLPRGTGEPMSISTRLVLTALVIVLEIVPFVVFPGIIQPLTLLAVLVFFLVAMAVIWWPHERSR
jgi:hypothetical protein